MASDWIKRRKAQEEMKRQEALADTARERLAAKIIKVDGAVYWDSLLPALNEQYGELEEIGYQAQAYPLDNQFCVAEKNYRIDIQAKGHWPHDAHASLIYYTGSSEIRVSSNIPKLTEISLYATDDGIRGVSNKDVSQMGTKELASYLLEGLVEAIEKQKRSA